MLDTAAETDRPLPLPVVLFVLSIFSPWIFEVGPLVIFPFRLVLLVATVPCLLKLYTGGAGRVGLPDFALLGYCIWGTVSLVTLHDFDAAWQPSGILFLESMGAYALARCYIRSAADFRKLFVMLFWCVAALMPFAVIETLTGRDIPLLVASMVAHTHPVSGMPARWGLERVQSVFEHPILFGVATGMILAPVHLLLGDGEPLAKRWARSSVVAGTSFLALSSGPLSALFFQIGMLGWNWLLGKNPFKWWLLIGLVVAMWTAIAAVSNRSVPAFLMSHFAFDESSAYARILLWEFGTQSVTNHPLLGVGLGQYDRPDWMTSSIDMFWLYHFIIFGVPAGSLMLFTFVGCLVRASHANCADVQIQLCRTTYLIAMTGFFLSGWAVHFWNGTYVLFLFLLASGAWIGSSGAGSPSRASTHVGKVTEAADRSKIASARPKIFASGYVHPRNSR